MSATSLNACFDLTGLAAVVTGASGAVGGAAAETLARAGAMIVVAGRSEARGHARVERIRSTGGEAGFRRVDLEQPGAAEQLLDFALGEHGEVAVLLNAASPRWPVAWVEATSQVFAQSMARQPGGGAVLNLLPDSPVGREAAHVTRRLASQHAGAARLNAVVGPCHQDPEGLAGLLLLLSAPRAGRRLTGCVLPLAPAADPPGARS